MDKLFELGKSVVTVDAQLKQLHDDLQAMRTDVRDLANEVKTLSERVTRLEAQREADRATLAAEIERFKHLVERAELRLQRPLPPSE